MEIKYQFDLLCNWIRENGGFINDKLSIDFLPNQGRFLKSNKKIESNELIIQIPEKLLLNSKNCNYKLEYDISEVDDINEKICTIVSFLKEYKNEDSFWEHYIYSLPPISNFYEHPIYLFHHGRMPDISKKFTKIVQDKYQEFQILKKYIYSQNIFDVIFEEEILWGYLIITTRVWDKLGLVPVADIMQNSYESNMKLKYENGLCEMISDRDFEIDNIVYDSYNVYDNVGIFANYGYIIESEFNYTNINLDYEYCSQFSKQFIREFIANKKNKTKSKNFQVRFEISEPINILILNINNFPDNIEIPESPNEYNLESEIDEINFILEILRLSQISDDFSKLNTSGFVKNSISYKIYKVVKKEQDIINFYINYLSKKVQKLNLQKN